MLDIRKTCVSSFDHTATRTQEFMHYESTWASPEVAAGIGQMLLTIYQQPRAAPQRVAEPVQEQSRSPPHARSERRRKCWCARCPRSRDVDMGRRLPAECPRHASGLTHRARCRACGRRRRWNDSCDLGPHRAKPSGGNLVDGNRPCLAKTKINANPRRGPSG